MEVIRVDESNGCIDLSKKAIKLDAIEEAKEKLKLTKKVHMIMSNTAIKLDTPVE